MARQRFKLGYLLALALCGCRNSDDVREWKPSDHDHVSEPSPAQVSPEPAASARPEMHGITDVMLVAWRQNCVRCHGALGRGDGPQGAMFAAKDLSDPELQAALSDEDIKQAILRGKGAMPSFQLPEPTVDGLVQLVRLLGGRGRGAAPADAGPATPQGSALPDSSPAPGAPASAAPPAPAPAPQPTGGAGGGRK